MVLWWSIGGSLVVALVLVVLLEVPVAGWSLFFRFLSLFSWPAGGSDL